MSTNVLALVRIAGAACFLFAGVSANAQFRASIQGTVTDPDNAVIAGAQLSLKDNGTNKTLTATSDASGTYNFNALPADHFTLTVTAAGFQQKIIQDLQLIPEQANSLNIQLELGVASTSITVSGSTASAVDTETANIGGTISSNDIQHTPSFNRDVLTLTQLAPGVISDGSQGSGGGVYGMPGNQGDGGSTAGGQAPTENKPQAVADGQQDSSNGISIDGISTVSAVWGGASVITPTEESVDNVRIVTNDYDAENGRFSGAQTLITSKSGTNQLHGSAFIAIHRPGLNAYQRGVYNAAGTQVGKPVRDNARFNQYGGSLGGPILKDKLFAFFAFESSPNNSTTVGSGWYDTAAFDALAPANSIASKYLNFPGNAVSATGIITTGETCATIGLTEGVNCRTVTGGLNIGSPLTSALGTQDLTSSGTSANPGVGSGLTNTADIADYSTTSPQISYYRQFNGRVDANVTAKDHFAFALYWVPQGTTDYNPNSRTYNLFHHNQINDAFSVIWNHTFSPSWLNEARANASGWRWNEIADNPQAPVGLPADMIVKIGSITLNQFGSALGSDLNQWTYGYKDVATKVIGLHTVKFGGEYTSLHYLNNPVSTARPSYTFYNVWDFLNDAPENESGTFNAATGFPGASRSDDRENLFGFFVQDEWRIAPNLTINAGIRYSYFGALYAKQNNLPVVAFGQGTAQYTGLSIHFGGDLWTPQKGNFGPQVGFNWSPNMFNSKLVVRGGYGLTFNQEEIAISANTGNNPSSVFNAGSGCFASNSPTSIGSCILYGISSSPTSLTGYASNPHTISTVVNSANLPLNGNASIAIFGSGYGGLPTNYAHHYSLDTEYQANRELVASAGYEGSLSRHLINHETPDAPAVVQGVALNPLVTGGDFWGNEGSANYNALLLELKHPFVHHFSADAQFQWAKSMDTDGSGPYYEDEYYPENPAYSYGRSDFNIGKSFKFFGLWQPVIFHGSQGWMEKVAGGWSLSGILQLHTGFPWSPNYGTPQSLYCSVCGYYNLRPYYLGGGGSNHSNKAFETGSNYTSILSTQSTQTATVNGSAGTTVAYSNTLFSVPNFASAMQAASGTGFPNPNQSLPPRPGLDRNAFTGPGYRDIDASLTKAFGLPNNRLLGEDAKLEIRADVFNLFNLLNLNPSSVNNNVNQGNFGAGHLASGLTNGRFPGTLQLLIELLGRNGSALSRALPSLSLSAAPCHAQSLGGMFLPCGRRLKRRT